LSNKLLFFSAFGAATILPFYSEIAVVGMLELDRGPCWVCFVGIIGNTFGAVFIGIMGI